jgi:hypothetical protein
MRQRRRQLTSGAASHEAPSRLLAGASIVEAHRLTGACVELDGMLVAGSMRKARWHGRRNLFPLFRIEVIDGGACCVAPARPLASIRGRGR